MLGHKEHLTNISWVPILLVFLLIGFFSDATNVPIIGVLTLESYSLEKIFPENNYKAYIAASYVKFLESAGARVVPVWIGQNEEYYEKMVRATNGMLFPGGATYFNETNGYGTAGKYIYSLAMDQNNNGIYYPILGICLGMQLLAFCSAKGSDIRVDCNCVKESLPLNFDHGFRNSKIFRGISEEMLDIFKNDKVTYNYHRYCLTEDILKANNLTKDWKTLTTNKDVDGKEFISVMEHRKYPFFGLQFHPEKNRFEFKESLKITHDLQSTKTSQYFAEFFGDQCGKNNNKFPNKTAEYGSLIYNYNPVFTAKISSYYQLYLFTQTDLRKHQV